ncbi:MAG TPA: MFS transporter [Rectinemataceae bacterium]|nr:MFS transporter [Rectinemataceae bacterium]
MRAATMENGKEYRAYASRWLVLGVYMLVNMTIQILWISYAPVTTQSSLFYGVSELRIGFFSMAFMLVFIPLSIPISWLIDKFGCKPVVAAGAIVTGICGILRGVAGADFGLAIAMTIGMAAAQPVFLNSWTKVSALWFPANERATAVGLLTLANLLGAAVGQVLTPILTETMSIPSVQLYYGIAASAAALLFLLIAREKPATPPDASAESERALMLDGLKSALALKSFRRYLVMAFIGLGIFNGVTTWIEGIVRPRGFDSKQAGVAIAVMLVAGILGAVVMPALSDKKGRRKPYIIAGLLGGIPGIVGLAIAPTFPLLLASSFVLGFFLVSVNPIGTQYASETALPTPEGTSNGLISLAGQISVVLVYVMEPLRKATGSYVFPLLCFAALLALSAALATTLVEASKA